MTFRELCNFPLLAGYVLVLAIVLGAVFGNFLNCMAWRMVHHESVWKGRSYCGERISPRYMIAELVSAGLWTACILRFGLSWETVRAVALICVLFTLSLVDLESWRIPNSLIATALVIYVVTFPLIEPELSGSALLHSLGGGLVIGGGLLVLLVIFDRVTGREGLGGGDIKLFFTAGIYLGVLEGIFCVLVSCFVGLIFAGFRKNRRIPFGPAISIGIVLTMFFGESVIHWYLGLL